MTAVRITDDAVEITFAGWERVLGLVRDSRFPLSSITGVEVVPDGYHATSGMRMPGLGIPRRRKLGTWRGRDVRQLVSVSAGKPAIRVRLTGERYTDLVIGAADAAALGAGLDRARR